MVKYPKRKSLNYYYLFDILLIVFIVSLSYYAYKERLYEKLFDYFKIFVLITISAKLASYTGVYLQKFHITKADTYSVLLLISFVLNLLITFYGYKYFLLLIKRLIDSEKFKLLIAKMITVIEVTVIITFLLFIIMQLHPSKKYLYSTFSKSYSYPYIEKFYTKFLNDDFTLMILNSNSAIDHKEVLFNSFKKAF